LRPGESLLYTDDIGFVQLDDRGNPVLSLPPIMADKQTFFADGTWRKPKNFTPRFVRVFLRGAGGGGGAGAELASATVAWGGGGGGGGCCLVRDFLASDVTDTVVVDVGTGGTAGAPGSAGAAGGDGGAGGSSTFGSYMTAYGGGGGAGGAISAATTSAGGG